MTQVLYRSSEPTGQASETAAIEDLIPEARQHHHRRLLRTATVALAGVALIAGLLIWTVGGGGQGGRLNMSTRSPYFGATVAAATARAGSASVRILYQSSSVTKIGQQLLTSQLCPHGGDHRTRHHRLHQPQPHPQRHQPDVQRIFHDQVGDGATPGQRNTLCNPAQGIWRLPPALPSNPTQPALARGSIGKIGDRQYGWGGRSLLVVDDRLLAHCAPCHSWASHQDRDQSHRRNNRNWVPDYDLTCGSSAVIAQGIPIVRRIL